jgi:hypothetical protein
MFKNKKYILLAALCFMSLARTTTPSQPTDAQEITKTDCSTVQDSKFESHKVQRALTAWLGLPEQETTIKNFLLNAAPGFLGPLTESAANDYLTKTNTILNSKLLLPIGLTIAQEICKMHSPSYKFSVLQLLKQPLPWYMLTHRLPPEYKAQSEVFLYLLNLCSNLYNLVQRFTLSQKLTSLKIATRSRIIPETMIGQDYFVLDSLGNTLLKTHYVLINKSLWQINKKRVTHERIKNPLQQFRSFIYIKHLTPVVYKATNGPSRNTNNIDKHWHSDPITQKIVQSVSLIPDSLPLTQRYFILKKDAHELLTPTEYALLEKLCYSDYRAAANRLLNICQIEQRAFKFALDKLKIT